MDRLLILFMLPEALIGLFLLVQVLILPKKEPMDKTNRIAHLRLVWFAISRPELFVDTFEWLKNDEYDNMKKKG